MGRTARPFAACRRCEVSCPQSSRLLPRFPCTFNLVLAFCNVSRSIYLENDLCKQSLIQNYSATVCCYLRQQNVKQHQEEKPREPLPVARIYQVTLLPSYCEEPTPFTALVCSAGRGLLNPHLTKSEQAKQRYCETRLPPIHVLTRLSLWFHSDTTLKKTRSGQHLVD